MRFEDYQAMIYNLAFKLSRNLSQLEDMMDAGMEAFVRAVATYDGSNAFSTYLYTVTRNAMIDVIRHDDLLIRLSFDNDQVRLCSDPSQNPERIAIFRDGISKLSGLSQSMLKDLYGCPSLLYYETKRINTTCLGSAFKRLMKKYGYRPDEILWCFNEIQLLVKSL